MSKKERLLRIVGLILILRDELEENEIHNDWCEEATGYIELLFNFDSKENILIKKQFEDVFFHIDRIIRTVDKPSNLIGELFLILKKDMKITKVTHPIFIATQKIKNTYDVGVVKLLDSKIRLV